MTKNAYLLESQQEVINQENHKKELLWLDSQKEIRTLEPDLNNEINQLEDNNVKELTFENPSMSTSQGTDYKQLSVEEIKKIKDSQSPGSGTPNGSAITLRKSFTSLRIADEIMKQLGYPKDIQFSFIETEMLVGSRIPGNPNYFNVHSTDSRHVVYSAGLIKEIRRISNLNYAVAVPITFKEKRFVKIKEEVVCLINMSV